MLPLANMKDSGSNTGQCLTFLADIPECCDDEKQTFLPQE